MIDRDKAALVVEALDKGCSLNEAADLAKVARKTLEDVLTTGIRDAEAGIDSDEALFAFEARSASARWRLSLRHRAAESATANQRAAGDWIRLLTEAQARSEPDGGDDVRARMVPIHDPEARRLAKELLHRISAPGPGPTYAEMEATKEHEGAR